MMVNNNFFLKWIASVLLLIFFFTACGKDKLHFAEPKMVKVEGGTFTMGCSDEEWCSDESLPQHTVTLSSFKISKYPVTQKQWEAVMGLTISQQRDKSSPHCPLYGEGDNYPVYYVSWDDAQEFIAKLNAATDKNYRLPTEAEWEFAARGGNKSKGYRFSGSNNVNDVAWTRCNSDKYTHPVGTKLPNELGIYDMCGNVTEWCNDWYGEEYYACSPPTNPLGPDSGSRRVLRNNGALDDCGFIYISCCFNVAFRYSFEPYVRNPDIGFRLVLP